MKAGDFVVTRRLSDGAEFVGRLRSTFVNGHAPVMDTRGVVHWRASGEMVPLPRGDARAAAFDARAEGEQAAAVAMPDPATRPLNGRTLAERICDLLAEGTPMTSRQIAARLDAMPETVCERMNWLENKGRVRRDGKEPRIKSGPLASLWALSGAEP